MRIPVLIATSCVALAACAGSGDLTQSPELTAEEVAGMSMATQDRYCAVLTEVLPDGSEGYSGAVVDQLVEVRSDVITDVSSMPVNSVSAHRDSLLSTTSAPRGWKLSAPCVIWRPAMVAARTTLERGVDGRMLPTHSSEEARSEDEGRAGASSIK